MDNIIQLIKKNWLLIALGVGVVLVAWVYFRGKEEGETKKVVVTLQHPDGSTEQYDPSDLVMKLDKALTSWCVVCNDRCKAMKAVYDLPLLKFMAFVKAYEELTGKKLEDAVKSVHVECRVIYNDTLSNLIVTRIKNLDK